MFSCRYYIFIFILLLAFLKPAISLAEESREDMIDDLNEKLDIISGQVAFLAEQENLISQQVKKENKDEPENIEEAHNLVNISSQNNSLPVTSSRTGTVTYPKILISEVQILPVEKRFIELFNPTGSDVPLSSWYIQRKDGNDGSWNSCVPSSLFLGKTIPANGFFYISEYSGNILQKLTLTNDNSLALKNPSHDISDKVGFGNAKDPANSPAVNPPDGQSIGRKNLSDGEQNVNDNSQDFELDTPTPGEKNVTYVAEADTGHVADQVKNVLINEVMENPTGERFVELYNPNDSAVDLTDWYLQRKDENDTSWQSLVSNTHFNGKNIPSGGYLVITKDVFNLSSFTLTDNNSLALKNIAGDISDQVSWQKIDENYSWGRDVTGDFYVDTPTPGAENIKYVAPVITDIIDTPTQSNNDPITPHDTAPPIGTISINNGALYTNNRNVSLTISATDDMSGVVSMKISNASSYHDWEPYTVTKDWQLPATNGLKTVRIKFKDGAGNETATGIPATITLDTVLPRIKLNGDSMINLNVGENYTEQGAVITDLNPGPLEIGGDLVETTTPSTFHVTYDTTDLAGNKATQVIRTVVVKSPGQ